MADTPAGEGGAWRTLAEAAVTLGLSERTIRRRIDAERIRAQQEDGRLLVWLPAPAAALADRMPAETAPGGHLTDSADEAPARESQDAGILAQLLREQIDGRLRAEQAAAMWQERARNLETENGRLQELLALPAHEEDSLPPVASEPHRHWWQWWKATRSDAL